ncbi:hypothetical protein HPB47_005192 [Ixodes persulcatus]|uniref:Uncharacterized protein n=1 Tax=Ixodes persulcatus TaxID=34615 RepID=A0AC60PDL3_IXOPE|nr:hypothetical protein HPB47_005192 [Ixodes persulcatus]
MVEIQALKSRLDRLNSKTSKLEPQKYPFVSVVHLGPRQPEGAQLEDRDEVAENVRVAISGLVSVPELQCKLLIWASKRKTEKCETPVTSVLQDAEAGLEGQDDEVAWRWPSERAKTLRGPLRSVLDFQKSLYQKGVLRCESCRRFGHLRDDCKKTYADVVNCGPEDDASELLMDQDEAGDAAGGNLEGSQPRGRAETTVVIPPPETSTTAELPADNTDSLKPVGDDVARISALQGDEREHDYARRELSLAAVEGENDQKDGEMDAVSSSAKRPLEPTPTQEPGQPENLQERVLQTWQTVISKRGRCHVAPQGPPEGHVPKAPQ